ncbi:serine/threonine-protein kinase HipA [Pontibacter aydingkolensis]|uniref:HipA domain-containing protein n=1 Tax=Pontibacter aydingkolensis TaxID=1911536 RepID=A0ABS7CYQ0_9BACT|nr:HipA domain-containing protein [Pontibacter aydingkolensis]MBW7468952.1 HipA domain-containing protein [Pontibacter aydingkolensis]
MKCLGCLKEVAHEGYCKKCQRELFGGAKVQPHLSFPSPHSLDPSHYQQQTTRISISGVQVKYSLKLEADKLILSDSNGQFILKPTPFGVFQNLSEAPANEHLTMQLARQVYKLPIPPNALVRFLDGSLGYIVRRFDVQENGTKLLQEDFAQISQRSEQLHGKNYKYDFSYEEIGELIKHIIPTYQVELEKYFKLILFNYLFSNGDAHIKNFSVMHKNEIGYVLTPFYDLLCTRIHLPHESDMALMLFKNNRFSSTYENYGFYTYRDFEEFADILGIRPKRFQKIVESMLSNEKAIIAMVNASFLNQDIKELYIQSYFDKKKRMVMY